MTTAALTFALCAMLASAALFLHAALQLRAKAHALTIKALAADDNRAPVNPWHALPGNVLELGASGFQIRLTASDTAHFFTLFSPEGCVCCSGFDMDAVKAFGEKLAGWRAQLAATPIKQPFTQP